MRKHSLLRTTGWLIRLLMAVFPIYKYKSTQSRSVGAVLPLSLRVILEPARFDCSQCHTKLFTKHKFLWTKGQFYPLLECFNLKGSECSGAKRKGLGVPWGRPASLQTSSQRIQFQETRNSTGKNDFFPPDPPYEFLSKLIFIIQTLNTIDAHPVFEQRRIVQLGCSHTGI